MAQVLSVNNSPNQSLRVTLNLSGGQVTLNLRLYFNTQAGFWVLDIADQSGSPLVSSVPLLTGAWPAANILAPYQHLGIGSAFVIDQSGGAADHPDDTNLGSGFLLLWDS